MGMSAEVIAIGPFRSVLVPFLEHPAERYSTTREGARLVEQVVYTARGNSISHHLARCLGIEAWDFNTHAFDPWKVDLEALREWVGFYDDSKASRVHRVDKFVALREAGFSFFFLPNG